MYTVYMYTMHTMEEELQMVFSSYVMPSSQAGFLTMLLRNCGRARGPGATTCLKTVAFLAMQ